MSSSSQPRMRSRFGLLAKTVNYVKQWYFDGETRPLSIEEILGERDSVDPNTKKWLVVKALPRNPRVEVVGQNRYLYKPPLPMQSRKALLNLLIHNHINGSGGLLLDDIKDSLPCSDSILQALRPKTYQIQRKRDKKCVIFFKDDTLTIPIDKRLKQLWKNVSVVGLTSGTIELYLEKEGQRSL